MSQPDNEWTTVNTSNAVQEEEEKVQFEVEGEEEQQPELPLEQEKVQEGNAFVEKTWEDVYTGGVQDLIVVWVPEGEEFIIEEYDGSESLMLKTDYNWIKA